MVTAFLGVLVALSGSLYFLEGFVPFPLPFGRWGFSNSVVLFSASLGFRECMTVAVGKSLLGGFLTGRFMSPGFLMGFAGSVTAGLVEYVFLRLRFGYIGASLAGSAVNNVTQILVGSFLIKTDLIYTFLPMFLILGSISAIVNAYLAKSYERVWRRKE